MSAFRDDVVKAVQRSGEFEVHVGAGGWVTIWGVIVDGDIVVRSYYGDRGAWYRVAVRTGRGQIRVAGSEWPVTFERIVDATADDAISAEYARKYARSSFLAPMLSIRARSATLRIVPVAR